MFANLPSRIRQSGPVKSGLSFAKAVRAELSCLLLEIECALVVHRNTNVVLASLLNAIVVGQVVAMDLDLLHHHADHARASEH